MTKCPKRVPNHWELSFPLCFPSTDVGGGGDVDGGDDDDDGEERKKKLLSPSVSSDYVIELVFFG